MADELNRQALPIHDTKPYKNYNFQTSQYFGLSLWKLVHSLNLVCSFQCCVLFMFDQTLAEHQLYRDKGLCAGLSLFTFLSPRHQWASDEQFLPRWEEPDFLETQQCDSASWEQGEQQLPSSHTLTRQASTPHQPKLSVNMRNNNSVLKETNNNLMQLIIPWFIQKS